jgi:ribose 5-phosphate isomerase A
MDSTEAKRAAAYAAMAELPGTGTIGLGTGSTARFFIDAVAEGVRLGKQWVGVPTSEQSRAQAAALGIPLLDGDGPWQIDVTVDGADEVDPDLNVIKGGGGAHTREKIVNNASSRNIIIVTAEKLSARVGTQRSLPVEVLPFAHLQTAGLVGRFGRAVLRADSAGPVRTDSGNYIYDVACGPINDASAMETAIHAIPGVVETGLFVGRVDLVIVADGSPNVRRIQRQAYKRVPARPASSAR